MKNKIIPLSLLGVMIGIILLSGIRFKNTQQETNIAVVETTEKIVEKVEMEESQEQEEIVVEETIKEESNKEEINSYETRLTSYYANDGYETGNCTGSGLCTNNFSINDKGWYTYQDKLVVATATDYLLKYGFNLYDGVHTYKYYDEIILNIDGIDYESIVLDSCGNCMKTDRVDLFVSNKQSVKDTKIIVKIK